jgi:hypothetical protein
MRGTRRIKIVRCLTLAKNERPGLPPFGAACIVSALRARGHSIVQDDLDARCFSPVSPSPSALSRRRLRRLLSDRARVLAHLRSRSGGDAELDSAAEHVLAKTSFLGFDTVLLSIIPADEPSSLFALCMARRLKRTLAPLVIVGGEYNQRPTIGELLETCREAGLLDYYFEGDGEEPLDQLFRALDDGGDPALLCGVRGLRRFERDRVVRSAPSPSAKWRTWVSPELEGLPLELYRWRPDRAAQRLLDSRSRSSGGTLHGKGGDGILVLPFQFHTVCPNRCAFCAQSGLSPEEASSASPEESVHQLELLARRYKTRCFFFLDDTINTSRPFIHALCDEILRLRLDILWTDCASARGLDEETLRKMKRAGAVRLVFGLETASPRLLALIRKKVTPEGVADVLRHAHRLGIVTSLEVIAGLPTERPEDVAATLRFLRENAAWIDEVYLNHFYLERNSLLYADPLAFGLENVRPVRPAGGDPGAGDELPLQHNFAYCFDEIAGSRWAEKARQIHEAFEQVDTLRFELGKVPARTDYAIGLLFHLFSILDDAEEVRAVYDAYKRRDVARRLLDPQTVVENLRDVLSAGELGGKLSLLGWKALKALHVLLGRAVKPPSRRSA